MEKWEKMTYSKHTTTKDDRPRMHELWVKTSAQGEHPYTVCPLGSQLIARDFYVDDCVTSAQTVEKSIQLAQEAHELCPKGVLGLHKPVSNNSSVLNSMMASKCATDINTKDLAFSETQIEQ